MGKLCKTVINKKNRNLRVEDTGKASVFDAAKFSVKNDEMFFSPRILRSPFAVPYWKDKTGEDIAQCLENHPEDWLKRFSEEGYNGILLGARMHTLVPSNLFPDVSAEKIELLKLLVERAARYGVRVYLGMQEPRGLPAGHPFWKKHPGLKGQPFAYGVSGDALGDMVYALCTSTSDVKEYLEESSHKLFREVKGLGGLSLITASEYHSHCYSHYPLPQKSFNEPDMAEWARKEFVCSRCAERSPAEVVAEIIELISRGARRAEPEAEILARTWSWYIVDPDPQKSLIGMLPRKTKLLADWERGSRKLVLDKSYPVDEYCYSVDGPSSKFRRQAGIASENHLEMCAKISINATHELRSVPYVPLPYVLAEKLKKMRNMGITGFEGSSPFGAEMTPMTRLASIMSRREQPSPAAAVRELAEIEFGLDNVKGVCRAWKIFGRAWRHYPFSIPVLYWGPMNYAVAWPFPSPLKKVQRVASWLPLPRDNKGRLDMGDNLETWISPFTPEIVIEAFRRLCGEWKKGVVMLEKLCGDGRNCSNLMREKQLAEYIFLSLNSTVNIIEYCLFSRANKVRGESEAKNKDSIRAIIREEKRTASRVKEIIKTDPRIGFHPEAYERMFTVEDLDLKIIRCEETEG